MGWKFNDKHLRKIYNDSKKELNMSYREFKRRAEELADQLISTAKKEIRDAKETIK